MWKQVASAYCLVIAASHPDAEAWALLPLDSKERQMAELEDEDGLIKVRKWYDGLIRPDIEEAASDPDDCATRLLSWETAQAMLEKFEWLDTEDGQRLTRRIWRDAKRQPFGFVYVL